MPDTLKSDKHVNETATDSNSGIENTGIGYVVHVAKRKAEEPCAVMPASTDLWEPRRSNPRGDPVCIIGSRIPGDGSINAAYSSYPWTVQ